jgi:hypothetical protein
MAQTNKIDKERWMEFLSIFSNGNRGRLISIEVTDMSIGDQIILDSKPLFAMDYDPVEKGNDLVITTGSDKLEFSHKIEAPVEIWELQNDNGKVTDLEIINQKGTKTIVLFKD